MLNSSPTLVVIVVESLVEVHCLLGEHVQPVATVMVISTADSLIVFKLSSDTLNCVKVIRRVRV
jgi:hypothetical protein